MKPLAPITLLLALLAPLCLAHAAAVPVARPVGVIVEASGVPNPVPFTRFMDVLVETLAGSRQWEPTVLTADSPLVRVSGAIWPEAKGDWSNAEEPLRALLVATRLSDLLVLVPVPAAVNTVSILWMQADQPGLKNLQLMTAGSGDTSYAALTKQLMERLGQGYASAQEAPAAPATPATTVAVAPRTVTPAPAAPEAPTAVTVTPGTPAATPATGRPTPAPAGPRVQPAQPKPIGVELSRPGTTTAAPTPATGRPGHPAPPAVRPTEAPLKPVTPAPAPAPTATAPPLVAAPVVTSPPPATVTPAPVTPPAVQPAPPAAQPVEPPKFLVAADDYLQQGDYKKVEDMLLRAEQAGEPKGQVYYAWARLEAARQNRVAERTWLDRAVGEDPTNVDAHLRLAEVLRDAGLWRKAADEYNTVLKAQPDNVFGYVGLSALYAGQSQPKRAAEILAEGVKHHPDDASLYLRLGDLYAQRAALADAEDAYDRAARLSEGEARADALDRLGDLYVGAQREHEGFICFAEAAKLRGQGNTPLGEKRYQQIMRTADSALTKILERAALGLQSYLRGQDVTREEAFAVMNDFNGQVQEISNFAESITPPSSQKLAHSEHKLAYSLAAEASLYGMLYLDQGKQNDLDLYLQRLTESRQDLATLQKPRS